ncbi:hypothetical protein EAT51_04275 [Pseudoxanthomonas winnipegensis]|uniref:hypothetical protein n=1 Tax=Pseudoxanthomonas winnipegensis TaxID=2480810 RepID=UPI00102D8043|nr:hypothetical protein [Pseudoxanthomonas winnipegensis]TAA42922.1 hypothetical protein EAT51_04275 [Pseudoxanthomonas winnipegensis]
MADTAKTISVAQLNRSAQASIAQVLAGGTVLTAFELIERVMALGYRYRPYVAGIVAKAHLSGMIERVSAEKPYTYRLSASWEGDLDASVFAKRPAEPASASPSPRARVSAPAGEPLAYRGPAFTFGPLAPSVGVVCSERSESPDDELPPCVGGRIVDSLHRRFYDIFGVE